MTTRMRWTLSSPPCRDRDPGFNRQAGTRVILSFVAIPLREGGGSTDTAPVKRSNLRPERYQLFAQRPLQRREHRAPISQHLGASLSCASTRSPTLTVWSVSFEAWNS